MLAAMRLASSFVNNFAADRGALEWDHRNVMLSFECI